MKSATFFFIFFLYFFCNLSQLFAWEGYDYQNKTSIEISEGNLVREGSLIQFYETKSDNFRTAKIVYIQSIAMGTEIELIDLDNKKTRFFIMRNY
jgi:hypothetical protein